MAGSTGKKKSVGQEEDKQGRSLWELILNRLDGKFSIVAQAASWAKVLRTKEEYRQLTANELLDAALKQVLSGEVTAGQILKLAGTDGLGAKETEKPKARKEK